MFIPELTTRVSVKMDTSELDSAMDVIQSDSILSEIPSLTDAFEEVKEKITGLQEPLVDGRKKVSEPSSAAGAMRRIPRLRRL